MCTLTWFSDESGYELHFNRDEALRRAPEIPPKKYKKNDVSYIAPLDSQANGTWIALTSQGIAYVLLNRYSHKQTILPQKSRGHIILSLIEKSDENSFEKQLKSVDLKAYAPFIILCFTLKKEPQAYEWDANALVLVQPKCPIVSSSFNQEAALKERSLAFSNLKTLDTQSLQGYHQGHIPQKGPLSVCVHRKDVVSTSYIQIMCRQNKKMLNYFKGSPCLKHAPLSFQF